jgi:tRNA pseudouridine32 synthase/23S rRNA pseudouridine746 synthase
MKSESKKYDSAFAMTPEEMQARVLHRDGLMLVIDKPAGLPVHRGPKGGPSLEDFFGALRFGLPHPPALAHRLDKETSGCLVLGRHRKALAHLGLLFKHGKVGKTYWAVVEGGPEAGAGVIDLPLGRLDQTRGWWMKPDPAGQPAVTRWQVLGRSDGAVRGKTEFDISKIASGLPPPSRGRVGEGGTEMSVMSSSLPPYPPRGELCSPTSPARGEVREIGKAIPLKNEAEEIEAAAHSSGATTNRITWLALEPLTGRTHQLRVHCAAMGWPILGDNIYGNAPRFGGPGLHLHARELVIPISKSRPPVRITAPVPEHLRAALLACGWSGEAVSATQSALDAAVRP